AVDIPDGVHSPRALLFPPGIATGDAASMTTTAPDYDWSITAIGTRNTDPHRSGRATGQAAAWTAALCAARTALLSGELDTVAVTIGDAHCCALYTPARDEHDHIDPDQLTAALLDLYQAATAGEIAELLTS
ncbi:MAG: hypothetical protein ACRDTH_22040, partial [Pseudonocardiaceae bacterium]